MSISSEENEMFGSLIIVITAGLGLFNVLVVVVTEIRHYRENRK